MPRLEAQLPEDVEPTGTTAEPVQDEAMPDSGVTTREVTSLAPEVEAWARREAPDSFAGVWVDQEVGGFAVAFAGDVDRYASQIREEVHPGLAVAEANHSYAELRDIQDRLGQEQLGQAGTVSGAVGSTGVQVMINRTSLSIVDPDEERLSELSEAYGATAICFEIQAAPQPPSDGLETLAKAAGWRDGLMEEHGTAYAVLEVAYDRETAEIVWRENVGEDLESRSDELPAQPGVYGRLDGVDFDRQVVVVWSAGESSGCHEWLTDLHSTDGTITLQLDSTANECPADYNPYRLVLAVDRDRLPAADQLPSMQLEGIPDGVVQPYPTVDG